MNQSKKAVAKLMRKQVYLLGDRKKKELFRLIENIIHPVRTKQIRKELKDSQLIGKTHDNKHIYLLDHTSNSSVIMEIGRLRELSFRQVKEGIHYDYIHTTAEGKRLLIMYGDEFDVIVKHSRWLAKLGNVAYDTLLDLNHYINGLRKWLGFSYWSLSSYLKLRVKNAVSYISSFEEALAHLAKDRGVNGVVCGHIHAQHHWECHEIKVLAIGSG